MLPKLTIYVNGKKSKWLFSMKSVFFKQFYSKYDYCIFQNKIVDPFLDCYPKYLSSMSTPGGSQFYNTKKRYFQC